MSGQVAVVDFAVTQEFIKGISESQFRTLQDRVNLALTKEPAFAELLDDEGVSGYVVTDEDQIAADFEDYHLSGFGGIVQIDGTVDPTLTHKLLETVRTVRDDFLAFLTERAMRIAG